MTDRIVSGREANGADSWSWETAIADGCRALGVTADGEARGKMLRHLELLRKWNRRLNLTAVPPSEMVERHLLDSLTVLPWLRGKRLLDIGAGAGFPGLPVACVRPELRFTLLDSRRRRIEFLRHVCAVAGIGHVDLAAARIEDYRPEGKFDTLLVRAVAPLPEIFRLTQHLHYPGLRMIALKGRDPQTELRALERADGFVSQVVAAPEPLQTTERHLVILDFT